MKKTFPLSLPGKDAARVLEDIKKDVRKYLKRERNKKLPEGVDYWDFDCKTGLGQETPAVRHVAELIDAIDQASAAAAPAIYIEILAKPGIRKGKAPKPKDETTDAGQPG
jgi:hypothetical protein